MNRSFFNLGRILLAATLGLLCSSLVVRAADGVPVITSQPTNQTVAISDTAMFTVVADGTSPLSYQWNFNGTNLSGATNTSLMLTNVQLTNSGNYAVLVTNTYGSALSSNATLTLAGMPDSFNPGANGDVFCTAIQADGKVLVGGNFTMLGGQSRTNIGRLNADGTLDTSFNPGANNYVASLAVQTDGKILVGGAFSMLGNQSRSYIGRFNADGLVDTTFNPGANGPVYSLVLQADNKILVAGHFGTLGGQNHTLIGRLNADGTGDADFNPAINVSTIDNAVYAVAMQADGKILLGGYFILGGQNPSYIGRLNADGTLDTSFNPGANNTVFSLVVQPDGKILVGGYFTTLSGQSCSGLGRLNASGTLDTSFYSSVNYFVESLGLQTDGKILVAGYFTTLGGQSRTNIGRLYANGALDTSFNPGANGRVLALAVQADGKVLLGGQFTNLGGMSRSYIGRLTPTVPATQNLTFAGSTVTWQRGGSSPEVWRTIFDGTTNGTDWVALGTGTRVAGGWQLAGVAWPTNATFRARGFVTGGLYNGSSWFVETTIGPAAITSQPVSERAVVGTIVALNVGVGGSKPLSVQWRKGGHDIAGATNTDLSFSNVCTNDAGIYSVVVSNAFGTVISSNAVLTVLVPPSISTQPASQAAMVGDAPTFTVVADGTPPFNYQWKFNGPSLSGATNASLSLTNVQTSQAGIYAVVVTNLAGSVTSSNAVLTVNNPGPPVIVSPPTNQAAVVGETVMFIVVVDGTLPLSYQWRFNGTNIPEATNTSLALTNFQLSQAGNYTVLVTNALGSVLSSNAVLTMANPGTPDSFNPGVNGTVYCTAVQADGKILVGGSYTMLSGQSHRCIGRLNADGTLDTNFNSGTDLFVNSLVVQADGKILVGGGFTTLNGQSRSRIGRLNADGTLDTSFNPGANDYVISLVEQADGKILVGGWFGTLGGQSRSHIGRLNADGTLDSGFNPGADDVVPSLAVQADGKILVGGDFTMLGGQSRSYIGRLNADGTLDSGFNPGADDVVLSLAVQADGKILVGGDFTMLGGQSCSHIGRLNTDGTLDTTFNPEADSPVFSLALQADGRILVGGYFTTLGGQSRSRIGLLNADGTLDTTFNPGADSTVYSLALQADGKILVGGDFTTLGGRSRSYIGRLTPTAFSTQNLTFNGSSTTWRRGGSSPEVWRTSFDGSTNGASWVALGTGTRVAGGWRLDGLVWPTNGYLRARGFVSGGVYNGSGGSVETITETTNCPASIFSQPINQTVKVGDTAMFSVNADGTLPVSYQWCFNGTDLAGATNTTLTLTNVHPQQAGNYAVLVTNIYGSILSSNAVLVVTPDHFTWNLIPSPRFANTPFAVIIRAQDMTNGLFTNFTGPAILGTTNGITVTPSVSGNFVQGVWTGAVVISQTTSNLVLRGDDGFGHFGLANPINVVSLPSLGMLRSGNIAFYLWPVGYSGFVLETSSRLSPATWVVVPYSPFQIGDQCLLPLDMGGTNGFYRLRFLGP
jgi:uncharacterized delta-60 repeat protein